MGHVAFQEGRFCMRNKKWDGDVVCCNMCVVLLFMKRDFVREMKKDIEIFRDMAAKWMNFQNIEDERGMDGVLVCGLVLFI